METLLAKAPLGLAILGRDYRYLRISESLAAMNGRTVEEHLGRHPSEVVGDHYWSYLRPLFERAMGGEEVLNQEVVASPHWDPGRRHHYRFSYYPLRVDGEIVGVGIVVHDVTDQQEAKAELQAAYEREHRIAEVLQRSLLRRPPEGAWPGLAVELLYKAARAEALVGGDFYDALSLPDGRVALIVGDVSGKGLVAAERTAEVKYTLRAMLRDGGACDPAAAVARVNRALCRDADPASSGFAFVALTLAFVDPVNGDGSVTVAGMEPPLVVRAGGAAHDVLSAPALPLGVDGAAEYGCLPFSLGPGDLLLLATDGLTEARAGSALMGYEAVAAAACAAAACPDLSEVGRRVLARAEEFAGGKLQDDACLLLARREPA